MKERIFIKHLTANLEIEEFVRSFFNLVKASEIELQHTALGTRIIIHTITPGLIIGKGGEKIKQAVEEIKKRFNIENPQIDVQKISNPYLDPNIVAQNIAEAIERDVNFKKVGNFYLSKIMDAGAIGCEIVLSGKFSGNRARTERFISGYIKKCGEPAEKDVVYGRATTTTKLGVIGVFVAIMLRYPGINIKEEDIDESEGDKKDE